MIGLARQHARFPFFNMMNNEDAYATMHLRPVPKLPLRSELHGLWLADAADLWYLGGGAFQQTTFGYQGRPSNSSRDLATGWDVSADVPASIYPKGNRGQLVYVETTQSRDLTCLCGLDVARERRRVAADGGAAGEPGSCSR